jgi:polyphosphate kinase
LYEASTAGVKITLIVRGICCLVPGMEGISENISVRRIVDRFLEHGRIFIFANNGNTEVYLGSADWMNRNIYRRIEVCFPVFSKILRSELLQIFHIQVGDNVKAVDITVDHSNRPVRLYEGKPIQSQQEISKFLLNRMEQQSQSLSV